MIFTNKSLIFALYLNDKLRLVITNLKNIIEL